MIQVMEYITNNYTWFLCGAILILLAIIGYYADKTNFGQGKNKNNEEKKDVGITEEDANEQIIVETENKIDNEKVDVVEYNQTNISNNVDNQFDSNNYKVESEELNNGLTNANSQNNEIVTNNIEETQNNVLVQNDTGATEDKTLKLNDKKLKEKFSSIADEINSITVLPEQYLESNVEEIIKAEEEFNKFDEEFNLFLPKKEVISTDLLSDIEELELDKTQKIDLSSIPDLDNISLPKIKNLVSDEQDIWKF